MEQSMREQLKALVEKLKWDVNLDECTLSKNELLAYIQQFEAILAASQPTVKAGWVCKDRVGLWFCEHEPELLADGRWITPGSLYLSKRVFTDPWETSHPNGGPECIMEVKP